MRVKGKWSKGEMARTIVIYLLRLLTMVLIWACALKPSLSLSQLDTTRSWVRRSICLTYSATPAARQSQNWACWLSREYSQKRMNR